MPRGAGQELARGMEIPRTILCAAAAGSSCTHAAPRPCSRDRRTQSNVIWRTMVASASSPLIVLWTLFRDYDAPPTVE